MPLLLKLMLISLPKREELSLRSVCAFPNASVTTVEVMSLSFTRRAVPMLSSMRVAGAALAPRCDFLAPIWAASTPPLTRAMYAST